MSDPKQVHIQGDVDISPGLDTSLGLGIMYINGISGGLDISGTSGTLNVNGASTLDQVTIDTTDGQFAVSGTNKINFTPSGAVEILSGATSFFKNSAGNIEIDSEAGTTIVKGQLATSLISDTSTVAVTGTTGVTVTSIANNVTVDSASNFVVDANSAIQMDAAASSFLTVTGAGDLKLNTTAGRTVIEAGLAGSNSITMTTTNAAGGIDIDAGTGGFDVLATGGGFSIDAQNTASNLSLATNANAQDLTIALTGTSDSSILISSTGTGADAIKITSSDTAGGLDIDAGTSGIAADTTGSISLDSAAASNFTVTGAFDLTTKSTLGSVVIEAGEASADSIQITATDVAGGVDINAGTGGITADTTAGFSIDSVTASNITLTGTDALTINNTAGQLILQSAKATADAVRIYGSNAAGGIDIDSGTGGIDISSQGIVSIDAVGVSSNFSLAASGAGQDLTLSLTGANSSSLNILSSSTSATDAIVINASAGGINIDAIGSINLDTTDVSNGVSIATSTAGVPVTIGTASSTTIISGNLTVSGTTTTVNTETLLVEDNIIVVNSGGGELGNDAGMVVRRYQTPGVTNGDVSLDTGVGVITSTLQSGSATSTLWTIAGTTNLTLTTVATGSFTVGMTITGTGITGAPTILSFSSGTGGSGSVAVLSSAQVDVVGSTDTITGSISAATIGPDTLRLNSTASSADNYYKGMWVKITSGTQVGKIRRIKDYTGSNRLATLYMTADNVSGFTDGLDIGGTASINGDGYSIYNSPYVGSFYDESSDKWVLAFTNLAPDPLSESGPSTVIIQRYASFESGSIVINANGDPATSTLNVNYINETTLNQGVTIEQVLIQDGLINGAAPDTTQVIELLDNTTTTVAISTSTSGSYMILVDAVQASSGAGSFARQGTGAFSVFAAASSGIGGAINRLVSTKAVGNERVDATWNTGETVKLQHKPARTGGTGALVPYRVKIQKVL